MKRKDRFNRDELKAVGRRLRLLRIARGWSLKKLSDVSDVSIAAIRKVELGESNPGLLTILALVEALDEPVDRLISKALQSGSKVQVVRASDKDLGRADSPLSSSLEERKMTGRLVSLEADEPLRVAPATGTSPLFGYVLEGSVLLSEHGGAERTCSRNDAFHIFDPSRDAVRGAKTGAKLVVAEQDPGTPKSSPPSNLPS